MPFRSAKQRAYLAINEPEVYQRWKKRYGTKIQPSGKHKSNPGSFTAQAKRAGMSVSAFAAKVLASPDDHDSRTVRRANRYRTVRKMRRKGS